MKYINTKTQAVIETACVIKGGNWKILDEQQTETNKKTVTKRTKKKGGE